MRRSQVIMSAAVAVVYLALVVTVVVLRVWPAAVLLAVFGVGWVTRLVLVLRRSSASRYAAAVLTVQLIGWLLAAAYFLLTRYWLGLFVAVILAGASFGYGRLVRDLPGSGERG